MNVYSKLVNIYYLLNKKGFFMISKELLEELTGNTIVGSMNKRK